VRSPGRVLLACCAVLFAATVSPSTSQAVYRDGPSGRHLLERGWYDRPDPAFTGIQDGFQSAASLAGWRRARVPMAANAGDFSPASYTGFVHWYRDDFTRPAGGGGASWTVRFESVNFRATVWLNGRLLGKHVGAYLPFELPANGIRTGLNRLVIRVDSRRGPDDIPPLSNRADGAFEGGWWNYNGILREVHLRKVKRLDMRSALVRPALGCRSCPATVFVDAEVANVTGRALRARVAGAFGGRALAFHPARIPPHGTRSFEARLRIGHPQLWEPGHPYLYRVRLSAVDDHGRTVQRYVVHTGIRSLSVNRLGRIELNGREIDLRGAAIHEDSLDRGAALSTAQMEQTFQNLRDLGATVTRAHYPLSPYELELADRYGILVWSEIPVYRMKSTLFNRRSIRNRALRMLRDEILRDYDHPAVMVWSLGNENASRPKRGLQRYIREAAGLARRLDPARLTGIAVSAYPTVEKQRIYTKLDVIGLNDYFGWYPGPVGSIADRSGLGGYLIRMHSDYPHQAFVITEVGAEANRHGPATEKGTYEFQSDFLAYHLAVFASKPFVNGAIVWALHDFRVKPGWAGGNPLPHPPVNEKGLIDDTGFRKPAFEVVRQIFRKTRHFR
jgi:beta-glucuronidase